VQSQCQKNGVQTPLQRTIPTNNNHQAIATKIITVMSLGVGEGIIKPSSNYSHMGNKEPILDKLIQPIGIVLLFLVGLSASEDISGKKRA
jgi:hypothetical protein